MSVACIDAWQNGQGGPAPGGTCTNVGCIPSKALLQSSEHYEQANHHFAEHGIEVKGVSLKLDTLIGRKNSVVKQNNDGILYLFKKNKVTFFHGRARSPARSKAAGRSRSPAPPRKTWWPGTWSWRPVRRRASCPPAVRREGRAVQRRR